MKNMKSFFLIAFSIFFIVLSSSYSNNKKGIISDGTTATGTQGCNCHNLSSKLFVTIELDSMGIAVKQYVPGQSYTIKLIGKNNTESNLPQFGFQVAVVKMDGAGTPLAVNAGEFCTLNVPIGIKFSTTSNTGVNIAEQQSMLFATKGTGEFGSEYIVENIKWTAPVSGTGDVKLYGLLIALSGNSDSTIDKYNIASPLIIREIESNSNDKSINSNKIIAFKKTATEWNLWESKLTNLDVINTFYSNKTNVKLVESPISHAGIIIGEDKVCLGQQITLSNVITGGSWSSGNTNVAIIDTGGVVTGINAGNVIITYTFEGSSTTKSIDINNFPSSIAGNKNFCIGVPTTFTDDSLGGTWSISNSTIASISDAGVVIGLENGTAEITYTNSYGCSSTMQLTIEPNLSAGTIIGESAICVGSITTFSNTVLGGNWSTNNSSIATIDATLGVLTGIDTGNVVISYEIGNLCGNVVTTKNIKVENLPISLPAITGVTSNLCGGSVTTLSNTITGGMWSSSNTIVATINSLTGLLLGVAGGNATITYNITNSCGNINTTKSITINPPLAITGTNNLCTGNTTTLSEVTTGGTWTSGNSLIATISNTGIITGITAGIATITYTKTGCYVTKPVTINANPLSTNTGTTAVCVGNQITLANTYSGGTWSSNNTSFAIIDETTGIVTGIAVGLPIIKYTIASGCYKTTTITVNNTYPSEIAGTSNICTGNIQTLTNVTTGGAWTTSNTTIATIGSTGIVNGKIAGIATITYTKTGCYVTKPVTINANPLSTNTGISAVCVGNQITLANSYGGGTWSSNNTSFAIIDETTGIVTGIAVGLPIIKYTIASGCYKTTTVTVNNTYPSAIAGNSNICTGNTQTLTDATTGGAWTSSNTTIATITYAGLVNGVTAGIATITYTKTGCYVTKPVTINANPLSTNTGTTAVCVGNQITLANSYGGGTWSSNNTSLALVDETTGIVTGIAVGLPIIKYSIASGCYKTTTVTVNNTYPSAIAGTSNICTGNTQTLTDATTGGAWASSNTTIATITYAGLVNGVTAGIATITYTKTGCYVTKPVTINANPLSTNTGTTAVCVGNQITLANTYIGGTWSSNNTSFALVDETTGIVTGIAVGLPIIKYLIATGCYKTTTVTVNNTYPSEIAGTSNICTGNTQTLTDSTTGGAWTSSNTTIATIGNTGIVNGKIAGTTTITYTKTGCYVTKPVTINTNPISITTSTSAICLGGTFTFAGTPTGGIWSSASSGIATIGETGFLTANMAGTSVLSYKLESGCYKTYSIAVKNPPSPITGTNTICNGTSVTFTDTALGGRWFSSASTKATVSTLGVVTGVSAGTAVISYQVYGCSIVTKPITINICRENFDSFNNDTDLNISNNIMYSIYPNPTEGLINIVRNIENNVLCAVKVTNLLGQTLYKGNVDFINGKAQIYLLNVSSGMYILELKEKGGNMVSFRFVVEK